MIELKRHVERIVRPIRAEARRKNKMREELLAHLTTVYDDVRPSVESDAEAAAFAISKFGEPSALREELQASVPSYERWLYFSIPFPVDLTDEPIGRSPARRATVFTACVIAMVAITVVVMLPAVSLWQANQRGDAAWSALDQGMRGFPMVAGMLAVFGVTIWTTYIAFDVTGLRARIGVASPTWAPIKAIVLAGFWFVIVGAFGVVVVPFCEANKPGTWDALRTGLSELPAWGWLGGLGIYFLVTTIGLRYSRRQYEEWGYLGIENSLEK